MIRRPLQRLRHALTRWPLLQEASGATVNEAATSEHTHATHSRLRGATAVPGICPYCAVGCGTLTYVRNGEVVGVEGDPESPINEGTLCPKGAGIYQYAVNPNRLTICLYRRPYGTEWEEVELEWAMDRIAERFAESRERTWIEEDDEGRPVRHTSGVAFLGGAALDNEENYLIKKLAVGTGVVRVENQARI
jgi:formate dehydrogenase major subunit